MKCLSSAFATEEPCFTRLVSPPAAAGFKVKVPLCDGPFFFFFFKSEGHLLGLAGRGIYEMCFTLWPGCATMEKPKSYARAGGQGNKRDALRFILLGGETQKERRMSGKIMTLFSARLIYIAGIRKVRCSGVFNHLRSPL